MAADSLPANLRRHRRNRQRRSVGGAQNILPEAVNVALGGKEGEVQQIVGARNLQVDAIDKMLDSVPLQIFHVVFREQRKRRRERIIVAVQEDGVRRIAGFVDQLLIILRQVSAMRPGHGSESLEHLQGGSAGAQGHGRSQGPGSIVEL